MLLVNVSSKDGLLYFIRLVAEVIYHGSKNTQPNDDMGQCFGLSPRLCPSTAGCSPPSMSSTVFCLLLS